MNIKTKKTLTAVISVALVLVIGLSVIGIGSSNFTNWNINDWFKNKGSTPIQNETIPDKDILEFHNTGFMNLAMAAAKSSAAKSSGITLTATILPATTSDKAVDWTVSFVNPSSAWANGKTASNYVSVIPTSDGATTATVSAIDSFGEKIKITVTSRVNSSATAFCIIDYGARLSDTATLAFTSSVFVSSLNISSSGIQTVETIRGGNWQGMAAMYYGGLITHTSQYKPTFTVNSTTESTVLSVKPATEFYTSLKNNGIAKSTNDWVVLTEKRISEIYENMCSVTLVPKVGADNSVYTNINKFNTAVSSTTSTFDFEIKVSTITDFETKDYIFQCKFNRSGSAFTATDITLDNTVIIL